MRRAPMSPENPFASHRCSRRAGSLAVGLWLALALGGCDASPEAAPRPGSEATPRDDDDGDANRDGASDPAKPDGEGTHGDGAGGPAAAPPDAAGDTGSPEPGDAGDAGEPDDAADSDGTASTPAPGVKSDDIRDASHVLPGTPTAHASAFQALPVVKGDGPPIGGIGPGGVHLDDLVVGRGWKDSRCETPASTFSVASDDKVSLCLRIVHDKKEEPLTILWTREGKKPREASVTVKGIHAYRTRAWLPVNKYSKGKWTVQVQAADGTLLGEGKFEITD